MTVVQTSPAPASIRTEIDRLERCERTRTEDLLAIEEPLEIRILQGSGDHRRQKSVSITMRTPGHDGELAAGFLFSEGIVQRTDEITKIAHCGPPVGELKLRNVI